MTDKQRALVEVQRRQAEARAKFNDLDAKESRTEAEDTEHRKLDAELRKLDGELVTAAKAVEDERDAAVVETRTGDSPEAREYRRLLGRASIGRIVAGAVEHRALDGAEREIQQARELAGNQIPLDLLRLPVEERAVTPGPTNVGASAEPVIGPVFATGAGAFLGVYRPTVPVGDAAYNVLTSRPTVGGPHSDSTDVTETTGAFDSDLLAPDRIQASFLYRRRDAARLADYDSALRMALNEGLQEKLDSEAIAGTNGLLTGTNLANHNVNAATSWANYISQFCFSRVDGRYATMAGDLRIVMGSGTYAHAGGTYRANETDEAALDRLMAKTGGVRVSAHVPAVASNKQNAVIRLGMRRDMVQPMWDGVTIITDEVTRSGQGEIEVTAVLLMNTKILRAAGFYKQQTQHA